MKLDRMRYQCGPLGVTRRRAQGLWRLASLTAGAALCSVAWAHHSFASFDLSKTQTLTGVVQEFQWTNPHMYIHLLVEEPQGTSTEWTVECGTPNINVRHGWKNTDLKPGDKVTLQLHPNRDGAPTGTLMFVKLPDGRTLYGTANDAKPAPGSAPPSGDSGNPPAAPEKRP